MPEFFSSDLGKVRATSFDVLTIINVLEHLRAPGDFLGNAKRILRPGGLVAIHVPNFSSLASKLLRQKWRHVNPLEHLHYFTIHTLSDLLIKNGLTPIERFGLSVRNDNLGRVQKYLWRKNIFVDDSLGIIARR